MKYMLEDIEGIVKSIGWEFSKDMHENQES